MDIMDLFQQTKQLCHQYNIKPARSRGQNFVFAFGNPQLQMRDMRMLLPNGKPCYPA